MKDDFWDSPQTGKHRKAETDPSGSGIRARLLPPDSVPKWLWYSALVLGALTLCMAFGGLLGTVLGLVQGWRA